MKGTMYWRRDARGAAVALGLLVAAAPALLSQAPARAAFDTIGARSLASGKAPGFSLAVVRRDTVVYARGFGLSDLERKTVVTAETPFAIGSLSKQFAAVSILQLVQRGKLSLDDQLASYLPHMRNARQITVRELLNQTSGLHNYPRTDEHHWPLQGSIAPESLFAILQTDTADFAPGTRWEYSNTNYAALAWIMSRVSGVPYSGWLSRHIFEPLGMAASGSGYAAQSGIATPYQGVGAFTRQFGLSLDLFYGAGGIVSTARDLARWDIALMQGHLLDASSMRRLWSAGALNDGTPVNYAMGFVPATLGRHREVWHNGLAPGAGGYCYNAIFPDDSLAVIVLSNGLNFTGEPERMVRGVLEVFFPDARQAKVVFTPAAGEDSAVTARARRWFRRLQSGDIDRAQLAAPMSAALTAAVIAQAREQLSAHGHPTAFRFAGKTVTAGATAYEYRVTFADGIQKWLFALDSSGKIAGMQLVPWPVP